MKTCTFFGHRNCDERIKPTLYNAIESLIINNISDKFYVGHNGDFDSYVLHTLRELKKKYTHISYWVVLSYIPSNIEQNNFDECETIVPDGIENVYKKFAILHRNEWMLKKSDSVIVYITQSYGGAAKFYRKALKLDKNVLNIANEQKTDLR